MNRLALLISLFSCFTLFTYAQKISKSRTSSHYTYIFKLSDEEAYAAADSRVSDSFMHNLVDSFYTDHQYNKSLPCGNYLFVKAVDGELSYSFKPVYNVMISYLTSGSDLQLSVADLSGKIVQDAIVYLGKKKIPFKSVAQLFTTKENPTEAVVTIKYQNITNYFYYEGVEKEKVRHKPKNRSEKDNKSVFIFNKPIYRPLDTVRFKAFILNHKGKIKQKRPLRVEVGDDSTVVIAELPPYRPGGYKGEFVLTEDLKLALNTNLKLTLKESVKGKWKRVTWDNFQYANYELKSAKLLVTVDHKQHQPGKPISIYLRAVNENNLTLPDARVEITLIPQELSFRNADAFVKDTLWKHTVRLDPVGDTKLVLPDSIFADADMQFVAIFRLLTSDNDSKEVREYLKYRDIHEGISFSVEQGRLSIDYRRNGKSIRARAKLISYLEDLKQTDSMVVELPALVPVNPYAVLYKVVLENGFKEESDATMLDTPRPIINAEVVKDSLRFSIDAKAFPFWYTIFENNIPVFSGHSANIDTAIRFDHTRPANIFVNYLFGGRLRDTWAYAKYDADRLKISLDAPDLVYPGQEVEMEVRIADTQDKPKMGTDVSAYAYTSKFPKPAPLSTPIFNVRKQKAFKNRRGSVLETADYSGKLKLNWDKWSNLLGLDTMLFYQFVQTKEVFTAIEDVDDRLAVVSPFAIKDGKIAPAFAVYIDDVPVYYDQATQLKRYAFRVTPGSHNIRIRIAGNEISHNQSFQAGKRTVIGIAADPLNQQATVKAADAKLSDAELDEINKYLVHINDNFSDIKTIVSTQTGEQLLVNKLPIESSNARLQIGPIADQYLTFKSGEISRPFLREPGYAYTFYSDMILQRSMPTNPLLGRRPNIEPNAGTQLDHTPITPAEIDSIWNEYLNLRSKTQNLFGIDFKSRKGAGQLKFDLDTAIINRLPYLKNIVVYDNSDPEFLQIYAGQSTRIAPLMPGSYKLLFLFKDNRYFFKDEVVIHANGTNYYYINDAVIRSADTFSTSMDRKIKALGGKKISRAASQFAPEIHRSFSPVKLDPKLLVIRMKGRVLDYETREFLTGANIYYKNGKKVVRIGVGQSDGSFDLMVPSNGELIFSFVSYASKAVKISKSLNLVVLLKEEKVGFQEVVIRGYHKDVRQMQASKQRTSYIVHGMEIMTTTGASKARTAEKVLPLDRPGLGTGKPLIIVDNIPYTGDLASIDPATIISVGTIPNAEAIGLYGDAAKYGVILVKTIAQIPLTDTSSQQVDVRSRFSDYAIWQPALNTDREGVARFKVRFPDDITSWTTGIVAINGSRQSGSMEKQIKSFKTLSANLSTPQFAIAGDSIRIIGKLMNYTAANETALRKFSYNQREILSNKVSFTNAHIDSTYVVSKANGNIDSLSFLYTMQQDNGYSDGEQRKIPLLPRGVQETKGFFHAFRSDTVLQYNFDPSLGKVTIRAESSVFPVLLDEIDKIRKYEYNSNEQMASKLKALLAEQQIHKLLGTEFKEERAIRALIKRLIDNRKKDGRWGWWEDSETEDWITLQALEALLDARKHGYTVADKEGTMSALKAFIEGERRSLLLAEQKDGRADLNLHNRLQLMWYNQQTGIPADIKMLLGLKKQTIMGGIYWGESSNKFWVNSIQNTILAYKIIRAVGGHKKELELIRSYFLEQRKDGQWRNTYESSLILETILPDMLRPSSKEKPMLTINGTQTSEFPFNTQMEAQKLSVAMQGAGPLYFTAYQQYHNPNPVREANGINVNSYFLQFGERISKLTAGKPVSFKVEVAVSADADYVMINVPIPAGCSYESTAQAFQPGETHREYFKHKASVFCSKLKKGKYVFSIELMPRYSGNYTLNPVQAEMMYFPVFKGSEGIKRVVVN